MKTMECIDNQRTLSKSVTIKGIGLHTGKIAELTINPAPINFGYRFQRTDKEGSPEIVADVSRVISTNRGTTIQIGELQVNTIEHVLSALYGLQVDNALMEINGPEIPILDGSAAPFAEAILAAGIQEQKAPREYFEVTEPISYQNELTGSELMALPSNNFEATVLIDFDSPVLGHQYASMDDISEYGSEIAPCRTFVFLHELESLINQNLIKGGDLDNAIVIVDRKISQEELDRLAEKLDKPSIKVEDTGILNTIDLHFKNEPARHKLLDVIGDLALVGKPIKGKIVATKPGHTANVEFAKILKQKFREQKKLKGKPKYDPNIEPIYTAQEIMKLLPHRHPFLLVDKIIELSDTHVVGIKTVSFGEYYFKGHFPGNPVLPGVLQMEALAQTGGILALNTVPDPENWDTYFVKIDQAKFKHKVLPGDTLILKMELLSPIRRGICQMYGTAYVGNKIVSEGELTAQIIRRNIDETK